MSIVGLPPFLMSALIAGVGVALVAGPLGCFVVWRRMAFFGDTISHGALLGVALGLALGVSPIYGVLALALTLTGVLAIVARNRRLGIDSWLGVFSHGSLALGLVAISAIGTRVDLLALLFGDILTVSRTDIWMIYGLGALVLIGLFALWGKLISATIEPDLARAEGVRVALLDLFLLGAVAVTVAIAMKVVGVLLVSALLIIPAASARAWSRSPEIMAVFAAVIGVVSVVAGLAASWWLDTPSGPSIVCAALAGFIASNVTAAFFNAVR